MDTRSIILIVSLTLNAICAVSMLAAIFITVTKGYVLEEVAWGKVLLRFRSIFPSGLFRPVSPRWHLIYTFNQKGRLWEHSPATPDVTRGLALFWLAHDLLWTVVALKTNQEPRQIRRGFTMAAWQLEQSGLSHHPAYDFLKTHAQELIDNPQNWSDERRNTLAAELFRTAHDIGITLNTEVIKNGPKDWYRPLPPRPGENDQDIAPFLASTSTTIGETSTRP